MSQFCSFFAGIMLAFAIVNMTMGNSGRVMFDMIFFALDLVLAISLA